jgi:hypothetical protein
MSEELDDVSVVEPQAFGLGWLNLLRACFIVDLDFLTAPAKTLGSEGPWRALGTEGLGDRP